MTGSARRYRTALWVAILAVAALVHAAFIPILLPASAQSGLPPNTSTALAATLSPGAAAMRELLLDAVQSGRLDDLKYAFDLNELKPDLAAEVVPDPMAFWRQISVDGEGKDVLAALGTLLEYAPRVEPLGKDPENTRLFIWPAFADRPLSSLTAEERAQLERLEGPVNAARMTLGVRYTGWRLIIGADGVWHAFRRTD